MKRTVPTARVIKQVRLDEPSLENRYQAMRTDTICRHVSDTGMARARSIDRVTGVSKRREKRSYNKRVGQPGGYRFRTVQRDGSGNENGCARGSSPRPLPPLFPPLDF